MKIKRFPKSIDGLIEDSFIDIIDSGLGNIKVNNMYHYFGSLSEWNVYDNFNEWWEIIEKYMIDSGELKSKIKFGTKIKGSPIENRVIELYDKIRVCHVDWATNMSFNDQLKICYPYISRLKKFDINLIDGVGNTSKSILLFFI